MKKSSKPECRAGRDTAISDTKEHLCSLQGQIFTGQRGKERQISIKDFRMKLLVLKTSQDKRLCSGCLL